MLRELGKGRARSGESLFAGFFAYLILFWLNGREKLAIVMGEDGA